MLIRWYFPQPSGPHRAVSDAGMSYGHIVQIRQWLLGRTDADSIAARSEFVYGGRRSYDRIDTASPAIAPTQAVALSALQLHVAFCGIHGKGTDGRQLICPSIPIQ